MRAGGELRWPRPNGGRGESPPASLRWAPSAISLRWVERHRRSAGFPAPAPSKAFGEKGAVGEDGRGRGGGSLFADLWARPAKFSAGSHSDPRPKGGEE